MAGFSSRPSSSLCPGDVRQTFHLRRRHAAIVLGITETCLKRIAEGRISRWPYRKFKKLKNLRRYILDESAMDFTEKQSVLSLISQDAQRLQTDPDCELSHEIEKLSAKSYKVKSKVVQVAAVILEDEEGAVTDDEDIVFWAEEAGCVESNRALRDGPDVRLRWVHQAALSCLPADPPPERATPIQAMLASKRFEIKCIEAEKRRAKAEAAQAAVCSLGDKGGDWAESPAPQCHAVLAAPTFQGRGAVVPIQVPLFLNKQPFACACSIASLLQEGQQQQQQQQPWQLYGGAIKRGSNLLVHGEVEMWEYNLLQMGAKLELEKQANLLRCSQALQRRCQIREQAAPQSMGGISDSEHSHSSSLACSSAPTSPTSSSPPPPAPPVPPGPPPFTAPASPPSPPSTSKMGGRNACPQDQLSDEESQLMQQQMEEADYFLAQDNNLALLCME